MQSTTEIELPKEHTEEISYSYDKSSNIIKKVIKITNVSGTVFNIEISINLTTSTIYNVTKDAIRNIDISDNGTRIMDEQDIYAFREIIDSKELCKNNDLSNSLLKSKYYPIFLGYKGGTFDIPSNSAIIKYIYCVPSMIIPFYMLDMQIVSRPEYIFQLIQCFRKNNSIVPYVIYMAIRNSIILPGLFIAPYIYIIVLYALMRMS
jgi:hypothetical protein